MATEEEWRRIGYERWVGEQGNNSIGTMHNDQGYQTYLGNQKQAAEYAATPVYTPSPSYWTGSSTPSTSSSQYFPSERYSGPSRPYKRTWVDSLFDSVWNQIKITVKLLLTILGLIALYTFLGSEEFVRIAPYLVLGSLVCLTLWLSYRAAKWFFKTKVGQFITLVLRITAYAALAVLITSIVWVVARSLGYV